MTRTQDGRTMQGVGGHGSLPLSHLGNVVTRIEIHVHTLTVILSLELKVSTPPVSQ